jgi:acetyl esterase/lipase
VTSDFEIAAPDGIHRYGGYMGERTLRLHRPAGERAVAAIVLVHGGGFVAGGPDAVERAAQRLADRLACVVVAPAYTLAGDAPFPAAVEDVYAVLKWTEDHAAAGGWNAARLVVAGFEAGGNLAAAAAMMARDRGGPLLVAQVLILPMLDPSQSCRSMREGTAADANRCRVAYRAYLASGSDQLHPYAAPLTSVRLAGLPPALIVSAADDPLRDEAEAYAVHLIRAGVTAEVARLPRIPEQEPAERDPAVIDAIAAFLGPRLAAPRHARTTHSQERTP